MKPSFNRLSRLSRIALASATITSAHAATWTSTTDGNWSTASNWSPASVPATSGETLAFDYLGLAANATLISTIDSSWATAGSVAGLTFGANGANTNNYTLKLGSGVTSLTIGSGGVNSAKTTGTILFDQTTAGSDINLGANQTWNVSGSGNAGRIRVGIDLAGSGNLTKTGTGALRFFGGTSTDWSGTFTLEGGELGLEGASQYARLGTSFNWKNTASSVLSLTGNGTFASNITFSDDGSGIYQFGNSGGSAVSVNLTGNYNGSLNETLRFQADPNSGNVYRISGNNSSLTSSLNSGTGAGAIAIRNVFVYLDSANALGTGNNLYAAVGENNSSTTGRSAGLLTTGGRNFSGKVKVEVNTHTSAVAQEVTLGLDGTGNASFTGAVTLGTTASSTAKVASIVHLSAASGGVVTFSGNITNQTPADTYKVPDIQIQGGGKVILSGTNTYTATTSVLANTTLQVDNTSGSGTGTGAVAVSGTGAILGGTGKIAPTGIAGISVSTGAFIAPGASIGTLTVDLSGTTGTVGIASGAGFKFELGTANLTIGSIAGGSSDLLALAGAAAGDFAFNGNNVDFLNTGAVGYYKLFSTSLGSATTWTGLTFDGTTGVVSSGLTYSNLASGPTSGEFIVGTSSNGGTVGDIYFHAIPEPAAALLGGLGMLTLLRRRRD
ncbi:MAG: hypothetical protein Q8Q59_07835 [Luteolibacter sp.]|jgi:hypothetical protein|nr:hypothetical protein [Luteolibacter sp.]